MHIRKDGWVLVMLVALVLPVAALAQSSLSKDKDQPIEIPADELEVVQPERSATFRGNVHVKQGGVTLTADQMIVLYREKKERKGEMGAVETIRTSGNTRMRTKDEAAQGDRGLYKVDQRKIWLMGNVVLTRGQNVLKGDQLEYSFDSGRSLVTSESGGAPDEGAAGASGGSGRVKAVFVPENDGEASSPTMEEMPPSGEPAATEKEAQGAAE